MSLRHVVLIDRSGYERYHHPSGRPFLDPRRYQVTLVTLPEKAPGDRPPGVVRVVPTDVLDPAALDAVVPAIAAGPAVDRVVAVGERFVVPAAAMREALGVPGDTVEQASVLRDKRAMKRHFRAAGITTPEFRDIDRAADAADLLRRHGAVVLKPVDSMGSVGVRIVRSTAELEALDAAGFARVGYEAEQFIAGELFHIDSVVVGGRPVVAVVSQYLDPNTEFCTGGHCRSANVDPGPRRDVLLSFNDSVLAAIPWFSGVTHFETFLTSDGRPVFCEIAGRPGGGGVVPGFVHRFGVDLYDLSLRAQLGEPLPALRERQPIERRGVGWSVIYPPRLGTVRSIAAPPDPEWLVKLRITKKPGDVLRPAESFGQGVAVATVCGPDTATIAVRLDEVKATLAVSIAEPQRAPELV